MSACVRSRPVTVQRHVGSTKPVSFKAIASAFSEGHEVSCDLNTRHVVAKGRHQALGTRSSSGSEAGHRHGTLDRKKRPRWVSTPEPGLHVHRLLSVPVAAGQPVCGATAGLHFERISPSFETCRLGRFGLLKSAGTLKDFRVFPCSSYPSRFILEDPAPLFLGIRISGGPQLLEKPNTTGHCRTLTRQMDRLSPRHGWLD